MDSHSEQRLDGAHFTELYRKVEPKLREFVVLRVGRSEVDDVVAETFAAAWQDRQRFDPELGCFAAWTTGIAANLIKTHHRKEARRQSAYKAIDRPPPRSLDEDAALCRVHAATAAPLILAALAGLDSIDEQMICLLATNVHGLSYLAIAQQLRIPIGTVRSRLHRARSRITRAVDRGR